MIQNMIQIVTGMLGSIGFAVMFHVQKEKLPAIAMGSAISWVVYLAVWCVSLAMVRGGETGRPGRAAALCGALALVPAALTVPVALQAAGLL